jgi:hypothetical protein
MEREDQKSILMIGGIEIFLLLRLVEVRACVGEGETVEGQPTENVMGEESKLMLEASQEEGKDHSEEWLDSFIQEAEKEIVAALKLTTEEEHGDKMFTPWEKELEMLEDWLKNLEPVDDCQEQKVMQMIAEEHSEESLRNFI